MGKKQIPLAKVIGELRSQLRQAREQGKDEEPRFLVDEAEIELQVGVTTEGEGGVGVNFWVYTAEAGGKLARASVQTIRLTLRPEDASGGRWRTGGVAPVPPEATGES